MAFVCVVRNFYWCHHLCSSKEYSTLLCLERKFHSVSEVDNENCVSPVAVTIQVQYSKFGHLYWLVCGLLLHVTLFRREDTRVR